MAYKSDVEEGQRRRAGEEGGSSQESGLRCLPTKKQHMHMPQKCRYTHAHAHAHAHVHAHACTNTHTDTTPPPRRRRFVSVGGERAREFLLNSLRDEFDFHGMAIRLQLGEPTRNVN